ncbi:general stress protein 69 [Clostridium ragsdalei P11]|uniref:General stress protein 69 n=1 Tax=Clostridium ragsdalei P11 TaxID=1353534 RepID=A0A1A6B2H5_9CLOT|nr:aldo/keto reductase [Clostridium ragsdalei]OBR96485.1 general stress protein 69 [Clostridium ragsdalei P11]
MQYRKFCKDGFKVSTLGFGCMRLPIINNDPSKINEKEALKIIRHAIDNGVNYLDTAYPYHGGNSEVLVGKVLKDGYRKKVRIATKMPVWLVEKYEDFDKYLNEQLKRLDVDYIDYYLLHAMTKDRMDKMENLGVFKFLNKALENGKINHVGFSFHDNLMAFKHIINLFPWEFCQIQFNYLDEDYQAGIDGLEYAADKGLSVVVMEPLKGGLLSGNLPEDINNIFNKSKVKKSSVDWALSWVLNHPEVSILLSGMNSLAQVNENISIASKSLPNSISEEDMDLIEQAKEKFNALMKIKCTRCGYCSPCKVDLDIPNIFSMYNNYFMYKSKESIFNKYNNMPKKSKASCCISCGKCEDNCPQHLPIRVLLRQVKSTFEEK